MYKIDNVMPPCSSRWAILPFLVPNATAGNKYSHIFHHCHVFENIAPGTVLFAKTCWHTLPQAVKGIDVSNFKEERTPMSVVETIRKTLVPIHKDGWPFIAIFFVVSIILGWLWAPLFWLGLVLTLWCVYFFRDPIRVTPLNEDFVLSPADGKISHIAKVVPPAELDFGRKQMLRISVFMNVFNCHVNRSPVSGRVEKIVYHKGSFLNAELDKASSENERNALVIDAPHGKMAVVQIAGLVARRIVCWAAVGDEMATGERLGLIRFGSRLDVYLPQGATAVVALGQTAIAGETVLARFDKKSVSPITRID